MVRNVFAENPYDRAIADIAGETQQQGKGRSPFRDRAQPQPRQASQQNGQQTQQPPTRASFEDAATRHNVPANVLMALGEAGATDVERTAATIAEATGKGQDLEALVGEQIMSRAYDIADELYGTPPQEQGGKPAVPEGQAEEGVSGGDVARQFGGEAVRGAGLAASGLGRISEEVSLAETLGFDVPEDGVLGWLARGGLFQATGRDLQDGGQALLDDISEAGRKAMDDSTPQGDIFRPSTYGLPEDPSLAGTAMLGAQVFGSLLPVVAASVAGGPVAGAAVGGLQGAEAGAQQAREVIEEAAADGSLAKESAFYQERIAGGDSPEEALAATIDRAEGLGFLYTMPISALGGAATGRILQGVGGRVGAGNVAQRVAGGAALGAAEEGSQEVAESVASRFGAQQASGLDVDLTQDTVADFVLGAMGGGPVGAVGGIRGPADAETEDDGTGRQADLPATGAAPDAPQGPLGEALRGAPPPPPTDEETAAAEERAEADAEAARQFPDQKPGSEIRLRDPEGRDYNAVFLREEPDGVAVRINGEEMKLTPQEFDEARDGARAAEAEAKAAGKPAGRSGTRPQQAQQPEPQAQGEMTLGETESQPAPQGVSGQAMAGVQPPRGRGDMPATIEETDRAIANVRAQARPENGGMSRQAAQILTRLEEHRAQLVDRGATTGEAEGTGGLGQSPVSEPEGAEPAAPASPPAPDSTPPETLPPAETAEAEILPPDQPAIIRRRDGSPYPDERTALRGIRSRGLDPEQFQITQQGGGFVALPKPQEESADATGPEPAGREEGISEVRGEGEATGVEGQREEGAAAGPEGAAPEAGEADAGGVEEPNWWRDASEDERRTRIASGGLIGSVDPTTDWAQMTADEREVLEEADRRVAANEGGVGAERASEPESDAPTEPEASEAEAVSSSDLAAGEEQTPAAGTDEAQTAAGPARGTEIDAAAAETDPDPTEAQKEAENYRTGKVQWNGLTLSIENAKGSERSGTAPDGTEWSVTMPAHYGRVLKTEGADGDHVDFYMGDAPESDTVLVIDQKDPASGAYDEHKVMLGFSNAGRARQVYQRAFNDGRGKDRIGGVMRMTVAEFKDWLEHGDTTKPVAMEAQAEAEAQPPVREKPAPPKPKRKSLKQQDKERAEALADYFTPGNIVRSYGGHDRVLAYQPEADGSPMAVTAESVVRRDGEWVKNPDDTRVRVHATQPEARELKRGPVERGTLPEAEAEAEAEGEGSEAAEPEEATAEPQQETAPQEPPASEPREDRRSGERIEDFGEKIQGAAKDVWQAYADRLGEVPDADIGAEPLSKSFPAPDYQALIDAGVDPWSVAFVRAARDAIPSKPRAAWKLKGWADQVQTLRTFANDLLTGNVSKEDVWSTLADKKFDRLRAQIVGEIELYEKFGHERSLKGMKLDVSRYSMKDGVRHDPPLALWEVTQKAKATAFSNFPKVLASAPTKEEAIEQFRKVYAMLGEDRAKVGNQVRFDIWTVRGQKGTFFLGKKIGKDHVALETFDSVQEARRYRDENHDDLVAKLERMKSVPAERRETNAPRVGATHRYGEDITPERFAETFGFRGVQFGNYVEGARRQNDLNDAYDALLDLAGVLNVPARALSLGGELGLAFGARGRGGKHAGAAHYEPGQIVINLTKRQGAGSLAHEWFHAVDNYFERSRGRKGNYVTDTPSERPIGEHTDIRPEVLAAFQEVRRTIRQDTDLRKRSAQLDRLRSKEYWGQGIEMHARAFEAYIIAKLADQGGSNDYLANIVAGEAFEAMAKMQGIEGPAYPYPIESEMPAVRAAFDSLFQAIETEETAEGVRMYARPRDGGADGRAWRDQLRRLMQGEIADSETLSLGPVPEIVRVLGGRGRDLVMAASKVRRVMSKHRGLPVEAIMDLPGLIADPVMVLDNPGESRTGDLLFVTDATTSRGEAVVVSIKKQGRVSGQGSASIVVTMYPNERLSEAVAAAERSGGVRYVRGEREGDGYKPTGADSLKAPQAAPVSRLRADPKILTPRRVFKDGVPPGQSPEEGQQQRERRPAAVEFDRDSAETDLRTRLAEAGIADRMALRLSRTLVAPGPDGGPMRIDGYQHGRIIAVAMDAQDPRGVLDHEVVHALRDPTIWGRDFGLFSKVEWQTLVRAARADRARMADIRARYPDLPGQAQVEEAIADMYADYRAGRAGPALEAAGAPLSLREAVQRVFDRMARVLDAIANAFRGQGLETPEAVMEAIGRGDIGRRRDAQGRFVPEQDAEMAPAAARARRPDVPPFAGVKSPSRWAKSETYFSDLFTTSMPATLSLVPGRPLFAELGKKLSAAQKYLGFKENMDALRNDWQARTDEVSREWRDLQQGVQESDKSFVQRIYGETLGVADPRLRQRKKNAAEMNERLMDVMHRATLAGVDPSEQLTPPSRLREAHEQISRYGNKAPQWAREAIQNHETKKDAYSALKADFDALPQAHRDMFKRVLKSYDEMGDAFEAAVIENMKTAAEIGLKRAERNHEREMRRIEDEGLSGQERQEAVDAADQALDRAKKRGGWSMNARIADLRSQFESNRLQGPYFPLARFGNFWVTVRDENGKVASFSRFESKGAQRREMERLQKEGAGEVQHGVLGEGDGLESQVDPKFVADMQDLLGSFDANPDLMDAVWQRWLETLPDTSIRTNRIHRKGRAGYSRDALRAFAHHMFHGSHQLARLKYGLRMEDALDDAEAEAARSRDPERSGLVVNEMRKRHQFTMAPETHAAATAATSLAFIWYLGVTPAAAVVNLSQTTLVGIPILGTAFERQGVTGAGNHLMRALRDFTRGRGSVEDARAKLSADERAAIEEAYKRGTIDKSQAHELASVADSGVQYNPTRERWMRRISFFFHHAERLNREVTFLAAYRMGREDGLLQEEAIDRGASLTWKTHFDYQNSSRPRIMQGNWIKVFTVFRAFTVNMLWRMFRDSHQALKGATPQERREARGQLTGITLSMAAHAGITGVWGYSLATMLIGMFFGGDGDDVDEWLHDALLVEGESTGATAWNYTMGMALNGVPGHVTRTSLTERLGMPNLWFRGPGRELEGRDLYNYWMSELLGPVGGIAESLFQGARSLGEGSWWRGGESMVPKFAADVSSAIRYGAQGVQTWNGDPIIEDVSPYQALQEALGFTPAQVAERYEANSRMKGQEIALARERRDIYRGARDALLGGKPIPKKVMDRITEWNKRVPEWPITPDTIRSSVASRQRASQRNEFGVSLNPKVNQRIRDDQPPLVYN